MAELKKTVCDTCLKRGEEKGAVVRCKLWIYDTVDYDRKASVYGNLELCAMDAENLLERLISMLAPEDQRALFDEFGGDPRNIR